MKTFNIHKAICAIALLLALVGRVAAQPGYAGEWKKTRLYGHSYNSGDFTDEEYDWIRDHFEYFTIEKTHLRGIHGNPSHELTSRLTATKLIEANPRCKPLMIYSIGAAYPHLFESEAQALIDHPDYFTYDENGDPEDLNLANPGENDWYVEATNWNTDNSDLYGIFVDGFKGAHLNHQGNVEYITPKMTGFRLVNGMDFTPDGLSIRNWPRSMEYSDGTFIDAFFRRRVMTADAGVVLIDACLQIPKDEMFVCFSAYDGYSPTYEFSHAAYLIVAHENTYYRWVDEGNHLWSSESLMTWHDDFGKEMGAPLSDAVKTGYAYERVFEKCRVNINIETKESSVVWDQDNTLVNVEGISISSGENEVVVGRTLQLSVDFTPSNSTYQGVSWSTSNPELALVDTDGLIAAKKTGTVTVTAISSEGGHMATFEVTIKEEIVTDLTTPFPETDSKLRIYPNPVLNELYLDIPESNTDKSIDFYSCAGHLIFSRLLKKNTKRIDLKELKPGLYFVRVNGMQPSVYKILKK